MATNDPTTRTECEGCWDEGCAVCEGPKWNSKPSETHGQRTYRGGASEKQISYLVSLGMAKADAEKLDKTEASKAIDRLRQTAPAPAMSEKQESFLRSLLERKQPQANADAIVEGINALASDGGKPRAAASAMIDVLKSKPDAAKSEYGTVDELEDGIYQDGDRIVKVYVTVHGARQKVGKVWDAESRSFEYGGKKALRGLTPAQRMTLEQAKEFGALYGMCCNCGATLTDETSIEEGIGPVCAKRFA